MSRVGPVTAGFVALLVTVTPRVLSVEKGATPENAGAHGSTVVKTNPLLEAWSGPYGGVPAFDRMSLADLKPALEAAMAKNLEEIDAIAASPGPPAFENTIAAMERSGRAMARVLVYWSLWGANLSSPEFRAIQEEMAPRIAEFNARITQNAALFARIKAIYDARASSSLRPDQQRLVWL